MKTLDRFLQRWRIDKARPFIPAGGRVLDIGCGDGALFERLAGRFGSGVGVDPALGAPRENGRYRLLPGTFPAALSGHERYDTITLLAVLEHIPPREQETFAVECARRLKPGGQLVVTVPSPQVDWILAALRFVRLIDGMSLEEHHGFDPRLTPSLFAGSGLVLVASGRFQFGLNHLFVFQKTGTAGGPPALPD